MHVQLGPGVAQDWGVSTIAHLPAPRVVPAEMATTWHPTARGVSVSVSFLRRSPHCLEGPDPLPDAVVRQCLIRSVGTGPHPLSSSVLRSDMLPGELI